MANSTDQISVQTSVPGCAGGAIHDLQAIENELLVRSRFQQLLVPDSPNVPCSLADPIQVSGSSTNNPSVREGHQARVIGVVDACDDVALTCKLLGQIGVIGPPARPGMIE